MFLNFERRIAKGSGLEFRHIILDLQLVGPENLSPRTGSYYQLCLGVDDRSESLSGILQLASHVYFLKSWKGSVGRSKKKHAHMWSFQTPSVPKCSPNTPHTSAFRCPSFPLRAKSQFWQAGVALIPENTLNKTQFWTLGRICEVLGSPRKISGSDIRSDLKVRFLAYCLGPERSQCTRYSSEWHWTIFRKQKL